MTFVGGIPIKRNHKPYCWAKAGYIMILFCKLALGYKVLALRPKRVFWLFYASAKSIRCNDDQGRMNHRRYEVFCSTKEKKSDKSGMFGGTNTYCSNRNLEMDDNDDYQRNWG